MLSISVFRSGASTAIALTRPRRTFVEPLPKLLPQRARQTRRLAQAQARIGLALGGEAALVSCPIWR